MLSVAHVPLGVRCTEQLQCEGTTRVVAEVVWLEGPTNHMGWLDSLTSSSDCEYKVAEATSICFGSSQGHGGVVLTAQGLAFILLASWVFGIICASCLLCMVWVMVPGKGAAPDPGSWPSAPRAKWGASGAPCKRDRAADDDEGDDAPPWRNKKPKRSDSPTSSSAAPILVADGCSCRCCEDVDPGSVNELLVEADGTEVRLIRWCCTTCPERNGGRCRAVLALEGDEVELFCWACESSHDAAGVAARRRTSIFTDRDSSYTRTQRSYHFNDGGQSMSSAPTSSWNVSGSHSAASSSRPATDRSCMVASVLLVALLGAQCLDRDGLSSESPLLSGCGAGADVAFIDYANEKKWHDEWMEHMIGEDYEVRGRRDFDLMTGHLVEEEVLNMAWHHEDPSSDFSSEDSSSEEEAGGGGKSAIDGDEALVFLGPTAQYGNVLICPELGSQVSEELERQSSIDEQACKAREVRALQRKWARMRRLLAILLAKGR